MPGATAHKPTTNTFTICLEDLYRLLCICLFPIRLVYSPEGRGLGNLSWPLGG
jgi:hypothetical protein